MKKYLIYEITDLFSKKKYYDFTLSNRTIVDINKYVVNQYKLYQQGNKYNLQYEELFKNIKCNTINFSQDYKHRFKSNNEYYKSNPVYYKNGLRREIELDTQAKKVIRDIENELKNNIKNNLSEEEKLEIKIKKDKLKEEIKLLKIDYQNDLKKIYEEYTDIDSNLEEDIQTTKIFYENIVLKNKYCYSINFDNEYNHVDSDFLEDINDCYDRYIRKKNELCNEKDNLISISKEEKDRLEKIKNIAINNKKFFKINIVYDKEKYNELKKDYLEKISVNKRHIPNHIIQELKDKSITYYETNTRKEMKDKFNMIFILNYKHNNSLKEEQKDRIIDSTKKSYDPNEKILCDICGGRFTKKNKSQHLLSKKHLKCIEITEDRNQ